jgi:uncharacterized membrane protein
LKKKLKQIFFTGLAVIIPIGLTLYILFFLIDMMDGLLKVMPVKYHPDTLIGMHIPYQTTKRLSDSMFTDRRSSFKRVVLAEFPRKGIYTIGFVTGVPPLEIREKTGQNCISVFLPTTPNPTSGYLIIVQEDELVPINISVEEALTFIMSVGIVSPSDHLKMKKVTD